MKAYIADRRALDENIRILQEKAGKAVIFGVLKGNGYGFGVEPMADALRKRNVDHFAVTELTEAARIRKTGPETEEILLLRATNAPEEQETLLDLRCIATIGSVSDMEALEAAAKKRNVIAKAHLKIDTGMGRYGFLPSEREIAASMYKNYPHVRLTGIYTHFHTAGWKKTTEAQYQLFTEMIAYLKSQNCDVGMVHCCNSLAFWYEPDKHCDAVRLGSALLGRIGYAKEAGLHRLGYAEADVEELRTLPKGHNVGYGSDCTLKRDTKIAVIGIGYYHGYGIERGYDVYRIRDCIHSMLRYLKYILQRKTLTVQVNGHPCPILGHVGMINIVADVTDIDCKLHDPVRVEINPLDLKGLPVIFR